jgi:hypothetical protein
MEFFSALKLALLGLLVVVALSPAAGVSLLKKVLLSFVGLLLLAAYVEE